MSPREAAVLPAPLTPADCDLRDFTFMPLDVVRVRDSDIAAVSSGDEFRCAVLLWCASWHQVPAASLPDDDVVLSQLAGYGRVVKEWQKVRTGALRGWIKCDDGRLYHPVVAEKANEAWAGRLEHRGKKEADRRRKAEARAAKKAQEDADMAAQHGGQGPSHPTDTGILSAGQTDDVQRTSAGNPLENALKERGTVERDSGQGQLTSKAESGGSSDSGREGDDDRLPPRPKTMPLDPSMRAVAIATLLTGAGVKRVTAFHPDVAVTWAQDERVTDTLLLAAVARAKETLGTEPFQVPYLRPIVVELLNPPAQKQAHGHAHSQKFDPVAYVNRNRRTP